MHLFPAMETTTLTQGTHSIGESMVQVLMFWEVDNDDDNDNHKNHKNHNNNNNNNNNNEKQWKTMKNNQ